MEIWYVMISVALAANIIGSSTPKGYRVAQVTMPSSHTEGPHWDNEHRVLYYVSISEGQIHRYDPSTGTHHQLALGLGKPVSQVVPVRGSPNKFVITLGTELVVLTWNWTTGYRRVCPLAGVECDRPGNRFNDGKADACGRLWAGTMGPETDGPELAVPEKGGLYRLDHGPNGWNASLQIDKASISNGMAWSADNATFYWVDMPLRTIYSFDFNITTGTISNRTEVFVMHPNDGYPDGMTIDVDDNLWIACFGKFQVMQVDPCSKTILRRVKIPAECVSSVAWGGEALDTLYVTTMNHGLAPEERSAQPQAGAVFKVTGLDTSGLPMNKVNMDFDC